MSIEVTGVGPSAVPLVLCLGAAWLLQQPSYLLFGLMSPLILAGTTMIDRLARGRGRRRHRDVWRQQIRAVEQRAELALRQEREAVRRVVGDPALLSRAACLPTSRLWERTPDCPDMLLLAVGTGDVPSNSVTWVGVEHGDGAPPTVGTSGEQPWAPTEPVMRDAPVTVDLVLPRAVTPATPATASRPSPHAPGSTASPAPGRSG